MTDPNSCYMSMHTQKTRANTAEKLICTHTHTHSCAHIDHGGMQERAHARTHTQTHTCTREKQRAHPEPSNVDSDPAIFKGHTSQDIISSSFVLRDLCLFTQHTHTHTRACTQALYRHTKAFTHTHAHTVGVNVPSPRICLSKQFKLVKKKPEMAFF